MNAHGRAANFVKKALDPEAAIECAADRAKRYCISAHSFKRSIVSVTRRFEKYARVAYKIRRRRIILVMEPAEASLDVRMANLPSPDGRDPWLESPAELEQNSRVVCYCPNCNVIRSRSCPCCAGTGFVSAWLRVREERLSITSVSFGFLARRIHPEIDLLEDFDRPASLYPAALDGDTGWGSVPAGLPDALQPPINPLIDRIDAARVQTFLTVIHFIRYRLRQGTATVEVAGVVPRVMPWSNWSPLELRLLGLGICSGLGIMTAVAAVLLIASWNAPLPDVVWITVPLFVSILPVLLQTRKVWSVARRYLPPRLGGHAYRRELGASTITQTTATTRA
jgi:hypothetical protein